MPGFPVFHRLPELAQIHVHWVSDANHLIAPGSFPMSRLFAQSGQIIGASASASVLPMNIQGWFPLGWTGWISLLSKGVSSLLQHHISKVSSLWLSAFFMVQLSHLYMTTGKTIALIIQTSVSKVMSLLFNMLSRCRSFSSKEEASFNFMAAVSVSSAFGAPKNKVCHCFHFVLFYLPWSDAFLETL